MDTTPETEQHVMYPNRINPRSGGWFHRVAVANHGSNNRPAANTLPFAPPIRQPGWPRPSQTTPAVRLARITPFLCLLYLHPSHSFCYFCFSVLCIITNFVTSPSHNRYIHHARFVTIYSLHQSCKWLRPRCNPSRQRNITHPFTIAAVILPFRSRRRRTPLAGGSPWTFLLWRPGLGTSRALCRPKTLFPSWLALPVVTMDGRKRKKERNGEIGLI